MCGLLRFTNNYKKFYIYGKLNVDYMSMSMTPRDYEFLDVKMASGHVRKCPVLRNTY